MTATDAAGARGARAATKPIVAASLGNALEYGYFAVVISKVFFPAADETVSLPVTLGTFGISFDPGRIPCLGKDHLKTTIPAKVENDSGVIARESGRPSKDRTSLGFSPPGLLNGPPSRAITCQRFLTLV